MSGALTLAIEMSNPSNAQAEFAPGVAIGRVDSGDLVVEVLGEERLRGPKRADADLLPAIDRLTKRLDIRPRRLDRVAVSVGPGGYTSVRIAVAAGQAICKATGARAVAVPSALVAAAHAEPAHPFLVGLASKRESVWITAFGSDSAPLDEGALVGAEEMRAIAERTGARTLLIDRFAPEAVLEAARALGLGLRPPRLDARGLLLASRRVDPIAADRLGPRYPREPEAVRKWRELGRD